MVVLVLVFVLGPTVAQAYCGSSADTLAVQSAAVRTFNGSANALSGRKIDKTYIMAIVVLQKRYAEADIEYAGQMSYYFQKKNGAWAAVGTQAPAAWPGAIRRQLTAMFNARGNGSKACTNPSFVSRGSGG